MLRLLEGAPKTYYPEDYEEAFGKIRKIFLLYPWILMRPETTNNIISCNAKAWRGGVLSPAGYSDPDVSRITLTALVQRVFIHSDRGTRQAGMGRLAAAVRDVTSYDPCVKAAQMSGASGVSMHAHLSGCVELVMRWQDYDTVMDILDWKKKEER